MKTFIFYILAFFFSFIPLLKAKVDEPEKVGNYLLTTSQQPGVLFGFGQNIVDKGDKQIFMNVNQFFGQRMNLSLLIPGFLYGIRDDLSLFAFFPIVAHQREGCNSSHGISDFFVQLEYTYLNNVKKRGFHTGDCGR